MYPPAADALVVKAKALVREAKRAGGASSQQDMLELQRTVDLLAAAAFQADGWLCTPDNMQIIEALLGLVDEMLAERVASPLCEAGVRLAALVLRSVPCGVAQICSQEADPASACGLRIIDSCLARLVEVCDEAEKQVSRAAATTDTEAAAAAHLALACTESLAASLDKLSPGDDGLLRSQTIWRAALEDTNAIALYLVRAFECACRLFTHCTSAEIRRRPQLAAQSTALYRSAGKVMDHVAAVFSSDAHLGADTGRKRSLMERFCMCALAARQAIMGSPPQFKAVWKALCVVATSFTATSFDGPGMCLKVYCSSCNAVRMLVDQAVALLQCAGDATDPKLQRRLKGMFAFVRFIVFQMPSLLARIRSGPSADDGGVVAEAMAMLDTVLGELVAEHMRVSVPESLSTMIHQLVTTVCTKFAVSLLTSFPQPIFRYLDALREHRSSPTMPQRPAQNLPLIEGVRRPAANREILRIATANIGAFAGEHQELLLTHPVPILMALAMAADCDVASVFAVTRGAGAIHSEQRLAASEYEQLACAAAQCAARVTSPELFAHWETAAMQTVCQAPPGSVGAHAVADGWGLLASTTLSPDSALSTVCGVLESAAVDPQRVSDTARRLLCRIMRCFAARCNGHELSQVLSNACRQAIEQSSAARVRVLCEVFPWSSYTSPLDGCRIGPELCRGAANLLSSSGSIVERAEAAAGLAALAPTSEQSVDGAWGHAHSLIREALEQSTGADAADRPWAVESALLLASRLPSTGRIHAVEILELCARNIASRIFALDRPAFQLAQFAGSFAAADWNHALMAPAAAALRDVFGHLLGEDVAWIVRHQAHLQLVRIATESADQSIAEALVPESRQASLVQFIQRVPSGTEMASADERASVYQSVFASLCWHAPGVDGVRANGRANGHANGKQEVVPGHVPALLDAIGVLRQRLEVAARTPMPPGASEAIRVELAQLAREIEHFQ